MNISTSSFMATALLALAAASCKPPQGAASPPPEPSALVEAAAPARARPEQFIRPASIDELQAIFDAKFKAKRKVGLAAAAPKPACDFVAIDLDKWGYQPFRDSATIRAKDGWLEASLTVDYTNGAIGGCPVRLRNYNGQLVGPTLRVKPGDTLVVHLDNKLPPNPPHTGDDINIPHDFNTTNFHTHGFHVSPVGNSDNVLLAVTPRSQFEFEIKIPRDHPPGTFWYHAHVHGSTALQVSSGMAGALIVEGGLDAVPEIAAAKEKIFVFQQIAYDKAGVIEDYSNFGPQDWAASKRQTTINGQIAPTITMQPGEVQRWRFIHGGVRETIMAELQGHELLELAVDGLALGKIDRWKQVELNPGYRSDILVKATLPAGKQRAEIYLVDAASSSAVSLLGVAESEHILARIVIEGRPLAMKLPSEASLTRLRPHANITDDQLNGVEQSVEFDIASAECDPDDPRKPCVPCNQDEVACKTRFMVNLRPFNDVNIRPLLLGTASKWKVSSSAVTAHPFHVHVNPFQYTREGPDGQREIIWRDTLLIPRGSTIELRSRYERYIGTFVLHCHILDHEDQGMMQLVEINNGASAHGH
jgi:FtsP/CotA-like multicopper oxidase with cupredoxin domain